MKKILSILLVACMLFSGFAMAEDTADTYTYDLGTTSFPTVWDPLRYQTATDGIITDYVTSSFYGMDYNESMDGYEYKPLAAKEFPIDVTAEYVGQFGIEEGDTAKAWKIVMREDLAWEDGTPIKAADFVETAKLLLNPKAANYRADSYYNGNAVIVGAEAYAKAGVESDTTFGSYMAITGDADIEALLANHGDEAGYINWNYSFGDTYDFEAKAWTGAAEDAVVDSGLTVKELYEFYTGETVQAYATWATAEQLVDWALDELYVKYVYPEYAWENVGMIATGDYELVVVLEQSLEGFYLLYSSAVNPMLVKIDLYNECITETDGVYNCTYGSSVETTPSWGPYKLVDFQSDKIFTLERNDEYFLIKENADLYQTTHINYHMVKETATRHEMFLNGQLDSFGLDKDYIAEYGASDYTYYSEGDSVFAMVFNPDKAALETNQAAAGENINKTILTVKDFRIAMSLAMNRSEFVLACDPTSSPAFALYGGQIVADPDNGIFYRTTDVAKNVVVDFWGLTDEIGEGKTYATIDDAIDSISGYNLEMAKQYFDAAYDQAIAEGLMDEDDTVQLIIGTPNNTSAFYNNGYDFIVNNYTEAVKGTKLEGKLTFTRDATLGNGFSDALKSNQVDMLFGVGWTGSTFDPYGLMEAYTSTNYQYDPAWDTTTDMLTIEFEDGAFTASVWDWTTCVSGTEIKVTDANGVESTLALPYSTDEAATAKRLAALGALENAVLQNYDFIPLMGDASASLKGMQVEFYTEDEVFPMGRGGVKYMTYNYTDAEWEAYVAEQGGTLNYK
ncbi:MAG: hypothetical protein IJE08_07915 [Clostridia bacterium]|nr:hypothetical protein [Clostridia bacterium]